MKVIPLNIDKNMVAGVAAVVTVEAEQVNSKDMVVEVSTFLYFDYCFFVPINCSLIFEPNDFIFYFTLCGFG